MVFFLNLKKRWLINTFVFLQEQFDILTIDKHFLPDLNIGKLTVPDLGTPEPFGGADFFDELFDGIDPLFEYILGAGVF